jgi:hypothetical protein
MAVDFNILVESVSREDRLKALKALSTKPFTVLPELPREMMSGRMGLVYTTFDKLKSVFGEPSYSNGDWDKVNAEWVVRFNDGLIATIYDYKTSEIPMGLYDWHIGGNKPEVVERVAGLLGVTDYRND